MPDGKITKLSEFIEKVRDDRESWGTKPFKELWFRGESKKHPSDLRPKLYRPRENKALKPIPDILEIENRLYEEFQHCGVPGCIPAIRTELRDGGITESVIFPDLDGLGREIHQLWEEQK